MLKGTIGVISPGEMGAGIGGALTAAGWRALCVLEGRGAETRARAEEAGLTPAPDLAALVGESEMVLSIVPPAVAAETADLVAEAMTRSGARPLFVECNAIAPMASRAIAARIVAAGAEAIDAGIIGAPPPRGGPRLYCSGDGCERLAALGCDGFSVLPIGPVYGDASALKMTYASMSKGLNALIAATLVTSERLGVFEPLLEEMARSQPELLRRAQGVPRLPADAARWAPEMLEISRSFAEAGAPAALHEGTAAVMELLANSPFGAETRRTIDPDRSMEETVRAIAKGM